MLGTDAKVIADSISEHGIRLTTMEVTLHRFVLAEFNTHRAFSRNSASSRAIPVETQLKRIKENAAYPIEWPCEQPGMQGGSELSDVDEFDAKTLFETAKNSTVQLVEDYLNLHPNKQDRVHKSVLNRLLEPYMWHTIVVSSTKWDNFWGLRCSPLAQPEIRRAAELMRKAYDESIPYVQTSLEWHTPYVSQKEFYEIGPTDALRISAARCARVSSLHAGDKRDYTQDFRLFKTLTSAQPPHASPLEHVAIPYANAPGNFYMWRQLRHCPEMIKVLNLQESLDND